MIHNFRHMRGLALAAGVAIAALAVPAQARDGEGYVGIDAGIAFPQDTKIDVSGVKDAVVVKNKKGFNFDAVLGYDWGMIRTEAEVGRASWKPKSITSGAALTVPIGNYPGATGNSRVTTAMANALLDFGGNGGVGFDVGVGAG